jgi:hypothetical protein
MVRSADSHGTDRGLLKQRYVAPYEIALIYAGLGDKPHALEWLDNAYEDHSQKLLYMKKDPRFDSLRADPRFQQTLRRMNLTP